MTELTTEIVEDDVLFRKWLWGELYGALEEAGFFSELDKEMKEYEHEVLYGTRKGEPVRILDMKIQDPDPRFGGKSGLGKKRK